MTDKTSDPMRDFYEVLPHIKDEAGEVTLAASFTPNNGIRIGLDDPELGLDRWVEFDFTNEQAEMIGQALVRWAQRRRAEGEMIRCGQDPNTWRKAWGS